MNRSLGVACVVLGIACLYFAFSSVATAHRERDRAMAAEAEARASEAAAGLASSARSAAAFEQPSSPLPSERAPQWPVEITIARLESIEDRLTRLETSMRHLPAESRPGVVEAFDTPESLEKALGAIQGTKQEHAQRIRLLERFLDLFPNDPRATEMLEALIAENLGTYPKLSLASLDRYGSRVVTDLLKLDKIRANVLIQNRRFDEGRSYYERVLRNAPDAEVGADASFWIAYSYVDQSNFAEARLRFEAIIARYGNDTSPAIVSLVKGAKNQLALIEQYAAKKQ